MQHDLSAIAELLVFIPEALALTIHTTVCFWQTGIVFLPNYVAAGLHFRFIFCGNCERKKNKQKIRFPFIFDALHTVRSAAGEKMPLSVHSLGPEAHGLSVWPAGRFCLHRNRLQRERAKAWSASLSVRYGVSGGSSTSYNLLHRLRRWNGLLSVQSRHRAAKSKSINVVSETTVVVVQ